MFLTDLLKVSGIFTWREMALLKYVLGEKSHEFLFQIIEGKTEGMNLADLDILNRQLEILRTFELELRSDLEIIPDANESDANESDANESDANESDALCQDKPSEKMHLAFQGPDHGVGHFRQFRIKARFFKTLVTRALRSFSLMKQAIGGGRRRDRGPFQEGRLAFTNDIASYKNPYRERDSEAAAAWKAGWNEARSAQRAREVGSRHKENVLERGRRALRNVIGALLSSIYETVGGYVVVAFLLMPVWGLVLLVYYVPTLINPKPIAPKTIQLQRAQEALMYKFRLELPLTQPRLGGCPRINAYSLLIANSGYGPCERNTFPAEIGSISSRNVQFT